MHTQSLRSSIKKNLTYSDSVLSEDVFQENIVTRKYIELLCMDVIPGNRHGISQTVSILVLLQNMFPILYSHLQRNRPVFLVPNVNGTHVHRYIYVPVEYRRGLKETVSL
jgi:hypothetical protein